jgi:hypothetical protein
MISWEHIYELALQVTVRTRLKNSQQLQRFDKLRGQYSRICDNLLDGTQGSQALSEGYDWTGWAGEIRKRFNDGVPLGFLSYPTISATMVFGGSRSIRLTQELVKIVEEAFGEEVTSTLLKEDYIGLPTISDAGYLTSANRCHHARHLATYSIETKSKFWDCNSIIEWGGGYGNMARIARRMNPSLTYIIIDLPELLALQNVYLGCIEGEDKLNIVMPGKSAQILPGKINLMTSQVAASMGKNLRADGFMSTWAITESPADAQEFVLNSRLFGAQKVLLASLLNQNNILAKHVDELRLTRIPVSTSNDPGANHEYWFR